MSRAATLDEIANEVARVLGDLPTLRAAYVFGSRTQGLARPDSDVDVGVLLDHKPGLDEIVRLEDRLQARLGMRVDVVDVGSASAFLALDVIRGRRVYCRDEAACDEFELYVLRRAGDLEPYERAPREMLLGDHP